MPRSISDGMPRSISRLDAALNFGLGNSVAAGNRATRPTVWHVLLYHSQGFWTVEKSILGSVNSPAFNSLTRSAKSLPLLVV